VNEYSNSLALLGSDPPNWLVAKSADLAHLMMLMLPGANMWICGHIIDIGQSSKII